MAIDPAFLQVGWANPMESAVQGLGSGFKLGASYAEMKRAKAQAEADALAKQQMQSDLANLAAKPTEQGYIQMMTKYPALSENLQRAFKSMTDSDQKQAMNIATQAFSAFGSGQDQVGKDWLDQNITAFENSGKTSEANSLRAIRKMAETDPKAAKTSLGFMIAANDPTKFSDVYKTFGEESRATEMQPLEVAQQKADTNKTVAETGLLGKQAIKTAAEAKQAQYEADNTPERLIGENEQRTATTDKIYADIENLKDRLDFDREVAASNAEAKAYELSQNGDKLSDFSQKTVEEAIVASETARQSYNSLTRLANSLESEGGGYGAAANASEWMAKQFGRQDALSALRQEYIRLRNQSVSAMLKGQGDITEKEREAFMKGFPPETANAAHIATFLRATAKVQQASAAYNEAKAEWVNQNNSSASSKKDLNILGVKVPKGTTFDQFMSKNMGRIIKQQKNDQVVKEVQTGQRSYMSAIQ